MSPCKDVAQVESHFADWVDLHLRVSPSGDYVAVGGDRIEGEGDQPFIGCERITGKETSARVRLSAEQIFALKGIGVRIEPHGGKNQIMFNDHADRLRRELDDAKASMESARALLTPAPAIEGGEG